VEGDDVMSLSHWNLAVLEYLLEFYGTVWEEAR